MFLKKFIRNRSNQMDGHLREVLNGASVAFALRIFGAAAAFTLNVAIGRLLGADGAGIFFLALSVALIATIIAQLGMGSTLLRIISSGAVDNQWGQIKGAFFQALTLATIASIAIGLIIAITAPWTAEYIFKDPALTAPLRWMSLAVVTFTVMTLLAESLNGLKKIGHSMLITGVINPVVALIIIWPLATYGGPAGASLAYVIGTAIATLFGAYWWHREMHGRGAAIPIPNARLWASARPLLVMNLIVRGIIPLLPIFLVGFWGTADDAGIFGAATRVALLASFFLTAVNTAIAPKFSELYVKGDLETLTRLSRRFALGVTLATSPVFLMLFFAGDWVMRLFGPDFTRGGTTLAILAVGQMVSTMLGSTGFMLIMSGHERDTRNASFVAVAVLGVLSLLAIPPYGIIGAAIATSGALIALNLHTAAMVSIRLNIHVLSLKPQP